MPTRGRTGRHRGCALCALPTRRRVRLRETGRSQPTTEVETAAAESLVHVLFALLTSLITQSMHASYQYDSRRLPSVLVNVESIVAAGSLSPDYPGFIAGDHGTARRDTCSSARRSAIVSFLGDDGPAQRSRFGVRVLAVRVPERDAFCSTQEVRFGQDPSPLEPCRENPSQSQPQRAEDDHAMSRGFWNQAGALPGPTPSSQDFDGYILLSRMGFSDE